MMIFLFHRRSRAFETDILSFQQFSICMCLDLKGEQGAGNSGLGIVILSLFYAVLFECEGSCRLEGKHPYGVHFVLLRSG
jgi:hypothetical protein